MNPASTEFDSMDALAAALQQSQAQYRQLVDSMDLGYILVDVLMDEHDRPTDLKYVDANAKAVRMTGAELVGRTTRELSPDFEQHWFDIFGRVATTGTGERHELAASPLSACYDFYAFKVGAPDARRVAALYQDITQRTHAELRVRENAIRQAFLLTLADAIRPPEDPATIQGAAARLLAGHLETARAFYGEVRDDGTFDVRNEYVRSEERSVSGIYQFDDFPPVAEVLRSGRTFVVNDVLAHPEITAEVGARFESFGVRAQIAVPLVKGGRLEAALMVNQPEPRTWTELEVSLVQETAERTWAAVARARSETALRDSEERLRRAHDELEARVRQRTSALALANVALEAQLDQRSLAEQQIKVLFSRLVAAQEEERRRLALDVHDQLGQQLTALRMNLELLQQQSTGAPAIAEQVGRTRLLADELDQTIDFMTWQLRPMTLDHLGLSDALDQLVSGWSERFRIAAQYEVNGVPPRRFRPDVEANLYRLAQEALHNVYKHAGATRATVSLHHHRGYSVLAIVDDGHGFNVGEARHSAGNRGLGLVGMRERAALAGGGLQIESNAGGTSVRVTVPAGSE